MIHTYIWREVAILLDRKMIFLKNFLLSCKIYNTFYYTKSLFKDKFQKMAKNAKNYHILEENKPPYGYILVLSNFYVFYGN